MIAADRQFKFPDAALKSDEVLLKKSFLLLDCTDLVLQFHIFYFLKREILLQVVFNSKEAITINL